MLEATGLAAWYGQAQALYGVDVRVGEGEVVALAGRNGAGKTTLLRCLIGLHRPVTGTVRFLGRDITGAPAHRRARAGMGWVQDDRGIYASLTVEENLRLPPAVSDRAWPLDRVYESFPVLAERRKASGTSLSGGEQQMLAIARVLHTGARLLLLDEPSEGLAPVIVQQIGRTIRELKSRGFTVLLVEQNFRFAQTMADRHYVMEHGRVVDMVRNQDLAASMDRLHEYLGV
jgi:branched-chain amino acid transport system ATP-binding protein